MSSTWFQRIALIATALGLVVVVLGAYVRLTHAGLGCPDWPGCYGQLIGIPAGEEALAGNAAYPERPVDVGKAWREMVHRYAAGILGLVVLGLTIAAWSRHRAGLPVVPTTALLALIIFQSLLGMWTVTLLLKPMVVTAHLLGGMATISLLWWLALGRPAGAGGTESSPRPRLQAGIGIAMGVLLGQIALGGWTSANYAALACTGFPGCYTHEAWPAMDFSEAFVLWRGIGIDYEGGVLHHPAREAVHMTHRIGALVVLAVVGTLGFRLLGQAAPVLRGLGGLLLVLLAVQIALGTANVLMSLPLPVAVAHNGVAALLMLTLVTLLHRVNVRAPEVSNPSSSVEVPANDREGLGSWT